MEYEDIEGDQEVEDSTEEESIPPEQFVQIVTQSTNLAADLGDAQLTQIAMDALADYKLDKDSMAGWLQQMKHGIDLAKLVKEDKNYPFKGSANIKYPLVTSAALQFNARAYPAIVPSDNVVKARVFGKDPQGVKAALGERVSSHMSYQLSTEIEEWEEDTDNLLVQLPIVGTLVRKWWFDPVLGRARCRVIDPGKFIVNDKVRNLSDAPRETEELPLYPSEIETRIRSDQFIEFEFTADDTDEEAAQEFIEQHRGLDLDEDGMNEPYIVTVHCDTQKVVRIVADFTEEDVIYQREMQDVTTQVEVLGFDGQPVMEDQTTQQEVVTGIVQITRGTYFVPYHFLPAMDGGFHATGLGLLLGDISDSINTIINMMLDAGHHASLGGGFIGSGFRMKGGAQKHSPGEWRKVEAKGQAIKDNIVPLTFPGPDGTLYQMLGMLIDAGREIASVKDVITGDSGDKVQTATATIALIEQGMAVFTAAYKRIFRSLKKEYRLLAKINVHAVTAEEYNAFHDGEQQYEPAQEYNLVSMDIEPVADPRSVTKMQEAAKAQFLMQLAEAELVDRGEATKRIIESMDIGETEKLVPKQDPKQQMMQEHMMKMQMATAEAEVMQKRADIELTLARIESEQAKAVKDMAGIDNDQARLRLDRLRVALEDERDRLSQLITRESGRMAGKSGNGGDEGNNGANAQGPEAAMLDGLLGGQPSNGGGQAVVAVPGNVAGGLL